MNQDLKELSKRKKDLLEKFNIAKDSAENQRLWEALPACKRAEYAEWYFGYCQQEIESMDRKLQPGGEDGRPSGNQ